MMLLMDTGIGGVAYRVLSGVMGMTGLCIRLSAHLAIVTAHVLIRC